MYRESQTAASHQRCVAREAPLLVSLVFPRNGVAVKIGSFFLANNPLFLYKQVVPYRCVYL